MNSYECCLIKTLGDDTYVYDIRFNKQMTIAEFIKQWVTGEKESDNLYSRWGKFRVVCGTDYYSCRYNRGKFESSNIPVDISNRVITNASANGGWGSMDIMLFV